MFSISHSTIISSSNKHYYNLDFNINITSVNILKDYLKDDSKLNIPYIRSFDNSTNYIVLRYYETDYIECFNNSFIIPKNEKSLYFQFKGILYKLYLHNLELNLMAIKCFSRETQSIAMANKMKYDILNDIIYIIYSYNDQIILYNHNTKDKLKLRVSRFNVIDFGILDENIIYFINGYNFISLNFKTKELKKINLPLKTELNKIENILYCHTFYINVNKFLNNIGYIYEMKIDKVFYINESYLFLYDNKLNNNYQIKSIKVKTLISNNIDEIYNFIMF